MLVNRDTDEDGLTLFRCLSRQTVSRYADLCLHEVAVFWRLGVEGVALFRVALTHAVIKNSKVPLFIQTENDSVCSF